MAKRSPVMAAKSATPTRTRAHRGRRARASVKFRRIGQFDSTRENSGVAGGGLLHFFVDEAGDLVADVPELLIEDVLLPLFQDFNRSAHGADDAAADDALGQLEVVKAEKLHTFVEIEQALGGIVQAGELRMAAIHFFWSETCFFELGEEGIAQARADVQ